MGQSDPPKIRMARSALGPNTPCRDLFLSPGHRLYLDGVLVPAVDLLNDLTISRASVGDLREIEYFHIKLDRHSVIYAEGAACETLQTMSGVKGDDLEEYRRLYEGVPLCRRTSPPALPCSATMGGGGCLGALSEAPSCR